MAGTVLERQLTRQTKARCQFSVATGADDAEIRRLLRTNPIPGRISYSLEREPSYFLDGGMPGETKQTIIAREAGELVCVGYCTVRERFVNGVRKRVGYLGGLRLDERYAGRHDILRRGYEFFRAHQVDAPADFYFTSIAEENKRAQKFLERGLPGMPRYQPIGEFVTFLLPTGGSRPAHKGFKPPPTATKSSTEPAKVISLINEFNQRRQFAPSWRIDDLESLGPFGLGMNDFRVRCEDKNLTACGALWDQTRFKQAVIRGYNRPLALARPVLNWLNHFLGAPALPAVGKCVTSAFVSHLAAAGANPKGLLEIISDLCRLAGNRGTDLLVLGMDKRDSLTSEVRRRFRVREMRNRLFVVSWKDIGASARELDDHLIAPETALL